MDLTDLKKSLKFIIPSTIYAINNNIYFGKTFNFNIIKLYVVKIKVLGLW